jgi:hypothetical protein
MNYDFFIPSLLFILAGTILISIGFKLFLVRAASHIGSTSNHLLLALQSGKVPAKPIFTILLILGIALILFGFIDVLFRLIFEAGVIEYYTVVVPSYQF